MIEFRLPSSEPFRSQSILALRLLAICVGIALFAGFVSSWSSGNEFLLFLIAIPIVLLIIVVGCGVLIFEAVSRCRQYDTRLPMGFGLALGPAVAVTSIVSFLPAAWAAGWLGDLSRLALEHDRYEAIVAEYSASPRSEWFAERYGITFSVDPGPPVRVAFNPGGFLDNWSGIVHDPSGEVRLADGFDEQGRFRAPDRITRIFEGDLVSCRWLWGDYYTCSFT